MRDLYIIGGISVAAMAIGGVLFFFGPSSLQSDVNSALQSAQTNGGNQPVKFTVLSKGPAAISINGRTNYRITSGDELAALWPLVYGQNTSNIPPIDFNKYEVLAVFDGSHSTNGYAIAVKSITDANATRTVVVTHMSPNTRCHVSTASTQPFQIVEVPKTSFTISHIDEVATSTCS